MSGGVITPMGIKLSTAGQRKKTNIEASGLDPKAIAAIKAAASEVEADNKLGDSLNVETASRKPSIGSKETRFEIA